MPYCIIILIANHAPPSNGEDKNVWVSLSQSFYPGGTLEIIFRSQGTPA
jgi:hypothetical protein